MKKIILTLSLLFSLTQLIFCNNTQKNEVLFELKASHAAAFDKDNLYTALITPTEFDYWYNAINEVKKFVDENSSNNLGIKDKDLINPLITIEKASMDLINTIKIIRASLQSPNTIQQNIAALETIKNSMIQVQNKLRSAVFILNKEQKIMARDILVNAAMFIETIANKAIRDTARL